MKQYPVSIAIGLMLSLLLGLPMPGHAEEVFARIVLEKAVHFTSLDGGDLLVPAGTYDVAGAGEGLRLKRANEESVFVIEAEKDSHDQSSELPIAVTIQGEGEESDAIFVGLLMPDRTSLEATGSFSGVQSRGFRDRAQQFRQNTGQALRNAVANVQERVPQVAVAICKGALRTRPAMVPVLGAARAQAGHILQDRQFQQLAQEAIQTILRDKADVIQRLAKEARFLAAPENRRKIALLLSGERICERPFHEIMGQIREIYALMPRPRTVQPATPEGFGTLALSGEATYIAGVQGAIGLILGAGETPNYGRLFWSLGGTVAPDIDAKGAVKVGMWFDSPPTGPENNFDLSIKGGLEGGMGVGIDFHFAWNRIRDEWQSKKLRSLIPYVSGFEIGPGVSITPGISGGLDIGYTRITRFNW